MTQPHHQQALTQLRDHLDQELAVHRRLLTLAEGKQRLVVAADHRGFASLLEEETAIMTEASRLRQVRDRLARAIGILFALKPEDFCLSRLMERAADPLRSELGNRQRELRKVAERLRQVNDRNLLLVRHGLTLVRDILQAVLGGGDGPAYDQRGLQASVGSPRGGMVDLAG